MISTQVNVILCLGDSLTAGTPGYDPSFGGNPKYQYGYWMAERAKSIGFGEIRFDNHGIPGDLASSMRSRLRRALENCDYDAVVLLAGSNDLGWGNSPATVYQSLLLLWEEVLASDKPLIRCTIPPIGSVYPPIQKAQLELNKMIIEYYPESGITACVNLFAGLSTTEGLLESRYDSGDGLHLSVDGYREVGVLVWDQGLDRIFAKK